MKNYSVRTDLALEEKERFASDNVEVQGVVLEEEYDEENEIRLTRVVIETENGAKIMGKPTGIYLTLESPDLALEVEENSRVLQERICDCIRELIFHKISCEDGKELKILFVGLGNRAVTPDALGPYVADYLEVNRHIVKEYGKYAMRTEQLIVLSAIVPGVMGQTGMETAEIVRGIVHDEAGFDPCSGCTCCAKQQTIEPDNPNCRYRNSSGFRCWKLQECNDGRISGGSCDWNRSAYGC